MEKEGTIQEEFNVSEFNFSDTETETTEKEETQEVEANEQPEAPKEETKEVAEEVKTEEPKEEQPETEKQEETVKISNPPSRYEGETDIQYNLRTQIFNAGQAKAQAQTEEEKSALSKHISQLRKELGKVSKKVETTESQSEPQSDSDEEQVKQSLSKMGYATKEEVLAQAVELVQQATIEKEQQEAIRQFYSQRKDIALNEQNRQLLEDIVINKFNINEKSSGQDILDAMDMAANYLFPKTSKSEAAREAAEKRSLVNVSPSTKSQATTSAPSKYDKAAAEKLRDMGWDESEIRDFLG